MKRIILLLATLAMATATVAQEKRWTPTYDVGIGLVRYVNYSAMSVLDDATPSYTGLKANFTFGLRRNDGLTLGLRYGYSGVNTAPAGMAEVVDVHDISILLRRSVMLTPRLELYGGVATGFAVLHNNLQFDGNNLTFNRYGWNASFEAGLRFYIGKDTYISLDLGLTSTTVFKKNLDIPTSQLPQSRQGALAVQALGGFGIGLRPTVKRVKMDASLLRHDQPLDLAWYSD